MLPTNSNERTQKFRRFGVFYGLSVAAICIIVLAFADGLHSGASVMRTAPENTSAHLALSADSLLHRQFSALENIDNQYNIVLSSGKSREGQRMADSLRRILPKAEQNFQFTLDSISRVSRAGSNEALKQTVDFFAGALVLRTKRAASSHSAFSSVPGAAVPAASVTTMTADEMIKSNPELKEQMLKKDIRIADLEAALNQLKKTGPVKAENEEVAAAATRQLQQDYETLQKNYRTLAETNTRLRNTVSQPVTAAVPAASAETDGATKTARARVQKMEQQLKEMNADLSFSTVDCNLSRADVNQIIYNGKQRKVLLQQALDILTGLKNSSDEEVQKRALQKIGQLNRIAMTVRD